MKFCFSRRWWHSTRCGAHGGTFGTSGRKNIMARRRWCRFGLVTDSRRIFVFTRYRVSSHIRGPFHRGMRVWRALTRSAEEPRSATERPNYERRRVTLLTLHATSNRRYVKVAPGNRVSPFSIVSRRHPRVPVLRWKNARSHFFHVRPSRGLRHFATCSTFGEVRYVRSR